MGNEKLSFNKRISLVKANVAEKLINEKELSKLGSGSAKSGYYNLSTIISALGPELLKNDLDLEVEMGDTKVIGTWIDCQGDSEKTKNVEFSLERLSNIIKDLERLPQMQNAIQTEGSIKTYFRRYAMTAFLNLPATDEIDSNMNGKVPTKNQDNSKPCWAPDLKFITETADAAAFNADELIKLIKALFNKSELLKLTQTEEKQLIEYLSIKKLSKKANISHEEFNKYLNTRFKKKNWFSLTAEEKKIVKEDLDKMFEEPKKAG